MFFLRFVVLNLAISQSNFADNEKHKHKAEFSFQNISIGDTSASNSKPVFRNYDEINYFVEISRGSISISAN